MKFLDTSAISATTGFPVKSGTLQHIQSAYKEAIEAAVIAMVGSNYNTAIGYVLYGCINSGSGSNYIISAGAVFYNGEVYLTDAATFTIAGVNVAVGVITPSFFAAINADPVEFTDGVNRNVHQIRKIVFGAGLSGSGAVNFLSLANTNYMVKGAIGQVVEYEPPTGNLSYFDETGLGIHPNVFGWAICNGNNGTLDRGGMVAVGYKPESDYEDIGDTGGEETHTLTIDEIPEHSHGLKWFAKGGGDGNNVAGVETETPLEGPNNGMVQPAGGGEAHNNMQPYIISLFIKRIA